MLKTILRFRHSTNRFILKSFLVLIVVILIWRLLIKVREHTVFQKCRTNCEQQFGYLNPHGFIGFPVGIISHGQNKLYHVRDHFGRDESKRSEAVGETSSSSVKSLTLSETSDSVDLSFKYHIAGQHRQHQTIHAWNDQPVERLKQAASVYRGNTTVGGPSENPGLIPHEPIFFKKDEAERVKGVVSSITEVGSRHSVEQSRGSVPIVVDGIYWSDHVERNIPKGLSESAADHWLSKMQKPLSIQHIEPASWDKCGRPRNAFVVMGDGSRACVRYRTPRDRLVYGEVMSYWLSRLLGMDCVPPTILSRSQDVLRLVSQDAKVVKDGDEKTSSSLYDLQTLLSWDDNYVVGLTRWIDFVEPSIKVHIPRIMLDAYNLSQRVDAISLSTCSGDNSYSHKARGREGHLCKQHVTFVQNITNTSVSGSDRNNHNTNSSSSNILRVKPEALDGRTNLQSLGVLAQWGTIIIFDYLTGNYDRVISLQEGAKLEGNPSILSQPVRNLIASNSQSGTKIWLIDNESGLLDAYTLLYSPGATIHKQFFKFHANFLHTMCVFQRKMVQRLKSLSHETKPHQTLMRYASKHDPLLKKMEKDESFEVFRSRFHQRLKDIMLWIETCRLQSATS